MSNPTLIEGFDDVMQHIRNQEKRIQELEKNNERLKKESESYRKKIDTLISQKHDLEAKVDEAQVAFEENKIYKKEIDTLRESVENECEASGIMEVMNMRIQDAEDKAQIAETSLDKVVFEKIKLHKEINELEYALEKAELCKCDQCSEYCPLAEIEDCFGENYQCDMVCLECRDEHYTQCDECMDYHHNSNITTIGERQVCSKCQEEDEE